MEKWYSNNQEIKEAKATGPIAAAFAVLMGTMGLWQAVERYDADPQEVKEIVEKNRMASWTPEQMQEWKDLQKEEKPEKIQESKERQKKELTQNQKEEKNIIARTLYAEAKGESPEGRRAVASVIWNRGGKNNEGLIRQIKRPRQFSCWNSFDWNQKYEIREFSGEAWDHCNKIAQEMIDGTFSPTVNWNHYYNPKLANPYWAYLDKAKTQLRPHEDIGNHRFMSL